MKFCNNLNKTKYDQCRPIIMTTLFIFSLHKIDTKHENPHENTHGCSWKIFGNSRQFPYSSQFYIL